MFGLFKSAEVETPLPELPLVWPAPYVSEHGPRSVRFTETTKAAIIGAQILSLAIVIIGILVVVSQANRTEQFATEGQIVQAEILEIKEGSSKSKQGTITYQYVMNGRPYYDTESVSPATYRSMRIGDHVPVTVLPNEPKKHRYGYVAKADARDQQLLGSIVVMGISFLVGMFAKGYRDHARHQLEVLRYWEARPAQAIRVSSQSAGKQGTTWKIQYRLLRPDGSIDEFLHSETGHGGPRANVGETFTVLVNPKDSGDVLSQWDLGSVEIPPRGTPVEELDS